eukprot:CAMPEP_0198304546 /NCGR_PEP_ID=MMETSP1449-20131203/57458_1 /TAXON_ID=420275 /ORGANISM="Attheya septentrionalis, Strain CCMP2084" /LENGTH=2889 /DNA_ID=CAMNT_0044007071 /DNA_START=128 /DNA_END=8797 /DNA_ORIENTATION=-
MALPPRPLSSSTGSSSTRKRREIEDIDNSNHSNSSPVCPSSPAAEQSPRVSSTKAQKRLKNSLIDQGMSSSENKQNQGSQDEKIDNGMSSAVSKRDMMPPSNANHGSNNVTASQFEVEKNIQIETEPTSDFRQNSNGTHANDGKPNNEKDEDAHKTQLIQMLKYRHTLLQRIRQCRDVADIQLDQSSQAVQEPKSDEISTEKSGEGMKDLSDNDDKREIEEFRKMARTAAQILKRQRPEQHAAETPRPTVTLRRGASVGKKMNAAVSSLTGNATYLTSDSSSSTAFTLPAQPLHLPSSGPAGGVNSGRSVAQPSASLTVTNPVKSVSQAAVMTSSPNMQGVSIATPVSSSQHGYPPSQLGSSLNMKQNLPLPIASGDGNRKGEISSKQRRSSATAQKNKRLGTQKNMKNNSIGQTSDSGGQVSSLPLHYGLGGTVLPHPSGGVGIGRNQQQMRQGSSSPVPGRKNAVICHEAMALRERRNTIRSKLGTVLYDQLNKIERSGKVGKTELSKGSVLPSPVTKVQKSRGGDTKKNPFTWAMVNSSLRGPGAPAQLPQRRKTQWDYVLEEMRWLATDFIEERKWKVASSQTLSCAVRSRRSIPLLSKPNQRPVKNISTDSEKQKFSILDQSSGEEELEATPAVNLVSLVSVAAPKIEYYKQSKGTDKACARMNAKLLSVMVTEHWETVVNGGIFAASDDTYATSFLRYRRLEKSIDRMVVQHPIEVSGNDTLLSVEEHNDEENDSKTDSLGKDQMDADMNGSENDNLPSRTKDELSRTISESPSDANWSDRGDSPRSVELSHETITKSITSSIEQIKNIHHDSDDRCRNGKAWDVWTEQLDGCGVKLNLSQLQACHGIEELWCCVNDSVDSYDFGPGAILSGSAGCGKTMAIGGMLWKQRQDGPQLVLCPPASLIRWRQSLSRYNDLNILTFGEHGGSYDYNSVQRSQSNMLGPRDILLCEFSCFDVLLGQFGCESNIIHDSGHSKLPFSTFILDSRHQYSAGVLASMRNSNSTASGGNLTNKKKKKSQSLGINPTGLASPEVASLKWWNNLLGAVSNSGVRRLLVHRYPLNSCRPEHYFEWFPDEKQGNELLACVAAFVHNPGIFHSQNVSTSRKVVSWAKRLSSSNLKGKSKNDHIRILDLDPTDPGARGVLKSALVPVFISLNKTGDQEMNPSYGWDIRFCTLSEAQRQAYDSCCSRARGALSVSGSIAVREVIASNERPKKAEASVNHYMLAAQALLRIRRVCLHSHISQLLRDKLQDKSASQSKPLSDASLELIEPIQCSMHRNHWLREKPQNVLNSSQPNFLLAQEIMDNSSKMKELLTILYFECGYHFASEETFLSMIKEEIGSRKAKDMNTAKRKVVILATLPEAQLLTSIFLNAVGIGSEVMLSNLIPEVHNAKSSVESYEGGEVSSPAKGIDDRANAKVSPDLQKRVGRYGDAIAGWVMCQTALARFDKNTAQQVKENTGGILISSPVAVSGLHSGLDSAAGEVVISLDEDWSGREALFLSSIQTRHIARHSNKVSTVDGTHGVHFIKIISRDTCEHEFLFNEKEARRGISQVVKEKEKVRNIATRKTVRRGRSASKVDAALDSKVKSDSDRKRDKDDGFIQPFQSIRMVVMTDEYGYVRTPKPYPNQSLPDEKPLNGSSPLSEESRSQLGVGSNVLRYRNVKLSILLRTHEPLPADFVFGKELRFIPYIAEGYRTGESSENANDGHNVDKMNELMMDIRFSEALAVTEALASPLSDDSVTYNQEKHVGVLKFSGDCVGKKRHGFSNLVVAVPLLPSIFPPTVVSRRDVVSIKARLYMQHFGRSLVSYASGDNLARTNCISSHQTEPLFLRSTPAAQGDAGINNAGIDLAEGWRRSGLSCKVNDIAASFLVYNLPRSHRGTRGVKRPIDYGALEDRDIVESHDEKQAADHALDFPLENNGDEVHFSWKKQRKLNGKRDSFSFDLMCNGNGQRTNAYSISFGASQGARSLRVRDGNVGCEPLLYFPPLFPGMRQCSQQVSFDLDYLSIDSRTGREPQDISTEVTQFVDLQPSMMSSSEPTRKRSHYATNSPSSGKRPRVSTLPNLPSTGVGTSVSHTPTHPYQPAPMTGSLYSKSRTEPHDPNSIPELIEPGIITEDEVSQSDAASMLVKLNDDFGLVGLGALPHVLDSAKAAASVPIETASYRQWNFHGHSDPSQADILSGFCVCDSEEAEMTTYSQEQDLCLQGMLLFVKKQSPSVVMRRAPASFHHQGVPAAASSSFISESLQLSVGAPGNSSASVRYFEGSESMRNSNKKTKKSQQHSGHTTVSTYPPLIHAPDVKDGYRNYSSISSTTYQGKGSGRKFTSAGAYFSTGTMRQNETLPVRLAIVRIRQQISNHVSFKLSTASQPGPGVPLLMESRVVSPTSNIVPATHLGTSAGFGRSGRPVCAVLKLSGTSRQTGDLAQSESITQQEALRRSMIAPCRVDFGPFQSGFLSSPRGMTGISPPRSRVGITLPMGVKVPQRQKEHRKQDLDTSLESWNTFEDQKLKECIQQFGLNWHLASRYLTGDFDNNFNPDHEHTGRMRSARQCSERWKILARRDTSISRDLRVREHKMRDMSRMTVSQIVNSLNGVHQKSINSSVLLSMGFQKKSDRLSNSLKHENGNAADGNNLILSRLKRMSLLKMAATKKQEVHITIPGYASGTLPETLPVSATHPSHMQSVQAALSTSTGPGGIIPPRAEMWPLQLLDLADKQFAANVAAAEKAKQEAAAAARSQQSSSSSKRRQQVPGVAHSNKSQATAAYRQQHQQLSQSKQTAPVSSTTQSQQELIKQAARAAAMGSSSSSGRSASRGGNAGTSSQHQVSYPVPQQHNHHPAPVAAAPGTVYTPTAISPAPASSSATPEVKAAALAAALGKPKSQNAPQSS